MTTAVVESERKYDVPAGASLPDWSGVAGVASVLGPEQTELDAHYFDTADLRLLRAGFTLRNRAGGEDAGWHAKVPAGGGDREELRFAPQPGMPEELAKLFAGIARGAELVEVARLKTTRTTWTLLDDAGSALAEVAADQVTATVPQRAGTEAATVKSWHEVEIELAGGADRATADRLGAVMAEAGFPVSSAKSKLARALAVKRPRTKRAGSAGAVVLAYVRKQADAVRQQDIAIRRDLPDAVHQARVASRKLRATLKTFRPVLRRRQVDPLREELQWYERRLSGARDVEVMSEVLHDEVGQVPVEHVLGPVAAKLTAHFAREEATAADTVARTMAAKRYFRMLDRLDQLLEDPPLRKRKGKKALRKSARKAWRRVKKAVQRSESATVGPELDAALHRARKETRKARYAADALKPAFGKKVRRWRKHLKALQDALGEQHDAVTTGAQLRQLAIRTHASGGNAYTYGLLYARQDEHGRAGYRKFRALWTDPPSKTPTWLR
ncbi:CYTH and CHAD domain-containing protein [Labedaea rhizosphaerae]|uniref:CHAD domain-containing protein n=1 Tax=Labedaea rhizosphaerae TaxID=598644 RepID=A0A4R6RSY4_LABRH|nr:CYTH and CHAD domain-containing protein [Labedaea rhizosphaerae]TDP89971.1 CHAD domain-containing protein [Labedaea rhizosphaerae]